MDNGNILLSKANMSAALSRREACKAGYNCNAISTPNVPGRWAQPGVNEEPLEMEEISV